VEKVLEKELPDGKKRFILYVLSAYLVNASGAGVLSILIIMKQHLVYGFIGGSHFPGNPCSRLTSSPVSYSMKSLMLEAILE